MPKPPSGLKAMEHPLKHKFRYSFGLNCSIGAANTALITLIKNYNGVTDPSTTLVNPKHASVDLETGAICAPMSIIQNLTLSMSFNGLTHQSSDELKGVKFWWMPVFGSFANKWDAIDDIGGADVAAMLQLTKDDSQEDMTPITTNKLKVLGTSDILTPVSTVNLAEVFDTHLNMTTNLAMEDCPFDAGAFFDLMQYGNNKGALKACVGKIRHGIVGYSGGGVPMQKNYFIRKFVPRPVCRIVPFSYFGIMINVPLVTEHGQTYTEDATLQTTNNHLGIKIHVNYDEWNENHNNAMV